MRTSRSDQPQGYETQEWLATGNDKKAKVNGLYFFHQKERHHNPVADDVLLHENFLNLCKEITGVLFNV